jgi:hypothetical protein
MKAIALLTVLVVNVGLTMAQVATELPRENCRVTLPSGKTVIISAAFEPWQPLTDTPGMVRQGFGIYEGEGGPDRPIYYYWFCDVENQIMRKIKVKYYWRNGKHQDEYMSYRVVNPGQIVSTTHHAKIPASEIVTSTHEKIKARVGYGFVLTSSYVE